MEETITFTVQANEESLQFFKSLFWQEKIKVEMMEYQLQLIWIQWGESVALKSNIFT